MTRQNHEIAIYFSRILEVTAGNKMKVVFTVTNKVVESLDLERDKGLYNSNDEEVNKSIISSIRNYMQIDNTKGGRTISQSSEAKK